MAKSNGTSKSKEEAFVPLRGGAAITDLGSQLRKDGRRKSSKLRTQLSCRDSSQVPKRESVTKLYTFQICVGFSLNIHSLTN